jgi:hypothetical protein
MGLLLFVFSSPMPNSVAVAILAQDRGPKIVIALENSIRKGRGHV